MWFEVVLEFVVSLFPTIQQTALNIMEWVTTEISLGGLGSFHIYDVLFGSALTGVLTWALGTFIANIIPG